MFVGFLEVLERRASGHPFENVPSLLPLNPWLGVHPAPGKSHALEYKFSIAL
jgi:hypothetical protein